MTPKKKSSVVVRTERHFVANSANVGDEEHSPPASKKRGVDVHSIIHRYPVEHSFDNNKRACVSQEGQSSFKYSSASSSVLFSGDGETESSSCFSMPFGGNDRAPQSFVGRTEFRDRKSVV